MADILARAPYEVGRCGWDQLAAELQARSPDLLVLLEEAGVLQPFIRRLKADDATWDLPIIVALAEFSDTAAAWALEVGADEFLLPPSSPGRSWPGWPWSFACNMTGASSWPPTRSSPGSFRRPPIPSFSATAGARCAISTPPCGAS